MTQTKEYNKILPLWRDTWLQEFGYAWQRRTQESGGVSLSDWGLHGYWLTDNEWHQWSPVCRRDIELDEDLFVAISRLLRLDYELSKTN